MKVIINATFLSDRPSGAKNRFLTIYKEFFSKMSEAQFVIHEPSDYSVKEEFSHLLNVECVTTQIKCRGIISKWFFGGLYWKRIFQKNHIDVYEHMHLPFFAAPFCTSILTIHDIRYLYLSFWRPSRWAYKFFLDRAMTQASCVVTVSNTMRDEIISFYPQAKVHVVHNCAQVGHGSVSTNDSQNFLTKYGLVPGYLLAVGHLEFRKNYLRLIEAILNISKIMPQIQLLIVGQDNGQKEKIVNQIKKYKLTKNVVILDDISDLELKSAYASAGLFIFPSLYEGFGIPIIEAMNYSLPIVLSDIRVFREIAENSAIYCRPDSVESIIDAIKIGLSVDPEFLKESYIRLLDKYTVLASVNQLMNVYKSIHIRD